MNDPETKPWYRHFWPWFIIALLAWGVGSSVYTVIIAERSAEPVLTEQPGHR